jgi:hypothetical protein
MHPGPQLGPLGIHCTALLWTSFWQLQDRQIARDRCQSLSCTRPAPVDVPHNNVGVTTMRSNSNSALAGVLWPSLWHERCCVACS